MTAASMSRPSLCIINWNGVHHLRRSLPAAERLEAAFAEILLVDNASTDDSLAYVRTHHPQVRILRLPENRGAGAARNAGLMAAVSDRILFIDNDVELLPGCAEALMAALDADPEAAAAQATVLYADRPEIIQYDGAGAHYLGLLILENADRPLAERRGGVRRTNSLITCCFMVDRRRIGDARFDENMLIYFDDHDFALALRRRGRALLAVPDARVLHGEGTAGMSIRRLGRYSEQRVFQLLRNRWLLLCKHHAARTLGITAPMLAIFEFAQLAIALKKGWARQWWRAARWMWAHRHEIAAARKREKKARRLPDRALLTGAPLPLRPELATSPLERRALRLLDRLSRLYWERVACRYL